MNVCLVGERHSLVFSYEDFREFPDITEELDNERPVITWLKRDKSDEWGHSVVIRGRTEDDLHLKVNDPDPATTGVDWATSDFMREWVNSDAILIRAKVIERTQKEITEYP